jgi:hypothetical protein
MFKNNSQKVFYRIVIITLFISTGNFLRGQSKVGTTAAPFLGISVAPRATAMGSAFTAVANDVTALYYNPGALARAGESQVLFSHTNWLVDTHFNWLGLVINLDGVNAIGFSLTQLDYGEEEVTTVTQPEGTGEMWSAMDFAAALTYCRNLTDRFSIGGSFKYIQQKIWNESASAFALDIGLLFITQFNDMRLGMSISNFGSDMQMDGRDLFRQIDLDPNNLGNNETIVSKLKTESWPLPLLFRVGVAMDILRIGNARFTMASDACRPSDNKETVNIGGELAYNEMVFIRGGYKNLFRDDSEEGLTLGVGVRYTFMNSVTGTFDYTYATFGLFEDIQMMSLGISF